MCRQAIKSTAMGVIDPGNPPMNPDGSFPDGVKANLIDANCKTIMVPNPPGFKYVGEEDKPKDSPIILDKITVLVNSQELSFPDQQPYIDENNRTMVPVRFVAEALGAKVDVKNNTVIIDKSGTHIEMRIGENKATVNGEVKTLDTKSVLTDKHRTMVPLRFLSETLRAKVGWNQATWTATVDL